MLLIESKLRLEGIAMRLFAAASCQSALVKRGGGRAFTGDEDDDSDLSKRGGARAFQADVKRGGARSFGGGLEKRPGGRAFMQKRPGGHRFGGRQWLDKRGGGRAFHSPLYYAVHKRPGARNFQPDYFYKKSMPDYPSWY